VIPFDGRDYVMGRYEIPHALLDVPAVVIHCIQTKARVSFVPIAQRPNSRLPAPSVATALELPVAMQKLVIGVTLPYTRLPSASSDDARLVGW